MGAKLLSPSRGIFSEAQCRLRHRHRQRHSTRCGAVWCDVARLDSRLASRNWNRNWSWDWDSLGGHANQNEIVPNGSEQRERETETERLETAPTVAAPANLFGTAKLSPAWLQVVTVWCRSSALGNLRVSREQKKTQLQNTCNFISFRLPAPNSRRI